MTRYIANYCKKNDIHTVVIGDITGIRKDKDLGHVNNQNFHALPYKRIYELLQYKLALEGIAFVMQKEAYSSQCSPFAPKVSKRYAKPQNRVKRGLYKDAGYIWNADCVGAYNTLRLYLKAQDKQVTLPAAGIKQPYVAKVAV
jgi:putative transposase